MNRTNQQPVRVRKHDAPATLETIMKSLRDHGTVVGEFRTKVDSDLSTQKDSLDALGNRLDKIEARRDRDPEAPDAPLAIVKSIRESPGFTALKGGQPSTGRIALPGTLTAIRKALLSTQAGGSPNQGFDVLPERWAGIGEDPRRRLQLIDALPHLAVTSNVLEYQTLDAYSSNADVQTTEGETKSETNVPLTLQSARIATIAHFVKASRQVLDDAPLLGRYLDSLLRYGVTAKFEDLVVTGALGSVIVGLLNQAGEFVPTAVKAADQISEAEAALDLLGWQAGLVILHPTDWHKIRSERTSGSGEYVNGSWSQPAAPNLWGVPIVTTSSLTAGTALVLDPQAVAILDRQQVTVMMGYENDDFTRNLVTLLAEVRAGFATFSNGGVLKFTLTF